MTNLDKITGWYDIDLLCKEVLNDEMRDYFRRYCDNEWSLIEKNEFEYFIEDEIIDVCFNQHNNMLSMYGYDYKHINMLEFQVIRQRVCDWEIEYMGEITTLLNEDFQYIIDKYMYFYARENIRKLPLYKVLKNIVVYENNLYDEHIGRWGRFYEDLQKKKIVKQNMMKISKLPDELICKIVDDLFKSENSCFDMRDFVLKN